MKRILLLFAAFLLILSGCSSKEDSPQFIGTGRHQEFWENGAITGTNDYYCTVNDQGLAIKIEEYENGILEYRSTISYDEFGNTLQVIREESSETRIFDYRNTLDAEGRVLRQEVWQADTMVSLDEYTYDHKGNPTSHQQTYLIEGEPEPQWRHYTMSYDKKGRLIREELRWSFNEKYTVWEYENDLCIRMSKYHSSNDRLSEQTEYTYDRYGNCILEVSINPVTGKTAETTEYLYDQQQRCTRENDYDKKGNLKQYQEYVYDDTARTKTRTRHYADGTVDEFSDVYTYDEYGNGILRERYRNGELDWRISQTFEPIP